jgi:hypothetical protein
MLGIGTGIDHSSVVEPADLKELTGNTATSLQLWLKNNTDVTTSQWKDSSGNDNHATQSSEADQATVSGGGLDFEETESDHYDLASTITIAQNQGFCMAAVIEQESASDNMILSKDTNDHIKIADQSTFRIVSNDDTQTTTTMRFTDGAVLAAGSKMLILVNRSAGAENRFTFFKNGTQLTFDTDTSSNEAQGENPFGFDINVLGARSGASQFFDGKILELAFWNRALTATEIADVNSYLQEIHGL